MSLQIWMPLNGDVHNQGIMDISPTTINTGSWVDGKIGKCYNSGANGYVKLNTSITLNGAFTIALWLNVNSFNATWARIFGFYKNDNEYLGMCYSNTTTVGFHAYDLIDGAKTAIYDKYRFTPTVGQWEHIAITYDGQTTIKWYKDGQLTNTDTIGNSYTINDTYTSCALFANGPGTGKADCCINDFRFYDNALTQEEIKKISRGLVVHYPLGEHGLPNLLRKTNQGRVNWSWSGNGGTRTLTDDGEGVKMVATTAANSGSWSVIGYQDNNLKTVLEPGGKKYTLSFQIKPPITTGLTISVRDGNATNLITDAPQFTVTQGVWNKVSVVLTTVSSFTVSSQQIYITGIPSTVQGYEIYLRNIKLEEGEIRTPWMPYWVGNDNILTNTYNFVIPSGGNGLTTDTFNGFKIRYLASREGSSFREMAYYNSFVPVVSGGVYTQSFWAKGTGKIRAHFYSGNISVAQNVSSQGVTNTNSDGNMDFTLTSEWKRYWVTHTLKTSSDTPTNKNILLRLWDGNEAYVCGWKLEKGDKATLWCPNRNDSEWSSLGFNQLDSEYNKFGFNNNIQYDVSGYHNNLTKFGNAVEYYTTNTPKYKTALSVGTVYNSGYSASTSSQGGTSVATLSAWVYETSRSGGDRDLVFNNGRYITIKSTGVLSTYAYGKSPAGYHDGTAAIPLNTWTHLAVVWDDSYVYGYINGVQDFKIACTGNFTSMANTYLLGEPNSTRTFHGYVSDVRFYSTAFSSDDVLALYQKRI